MTTLNNKFQLDVDMNCWWALRSVDMDFRMNLMAQFMVRAGLQGLTR